MTRKKQNLDIIEMLRSAICDPGGQNFFVALNCAMLDLDLTTTDIAVRFDMSISSARRWRDGASTPHPAMQVLTYKYLLDRCLKNEIFKIQSGDPRAIARLRERNERDGPTETAKYYGVHRGTVHRWVGRK